MAMGKVVHLQNLFGDGGVTSGLMNCFILMNAKIF